MALRRSAHWRFCSGCMMFVLSVCLYQTSDQRRAVPTAARWVQMFVKRKSQTLGTPLWSAELPHLPEKCPDTPDTSHLLPNHATRSITETDGDCYRVWVMQTHVICTHLLCDLYFLDLLTARWVFTLILQFMSFKNSGLVQTCSLFICKFLVFLISRFFCYNKLLECNKSVSS